MSEAREGLEQAWEFVAASEGSTEMMPSRPTGVQAAHGVVHVAMEPGGVRHLLVPVARREDVVADRRSRGVVVVPQDLEIAGERRWFADLVCVEHALVEVYTRLAEAVCESIAVEPQLAGSAPARVLDEWRELLSSRKSSLGPQAIAGLLGELVFMRRGIDSVGANLFSSWLGPEGHQHDFSAPGLAVEVKATTAREGRRVEIHGLEQLAPGPESVLYLCFVRLGAEPEGRTISEVVRSIAGLGVQYRELLRRLKKAGYEPEELDEVRYSVKEFAIYEVSPEFPALTVASFPGGPPRGVESVRYVVDLAAAGEPLDDRFHNRVFKGLLAK